MTFLSIGVPARKRTLVRLKVTAGVFHHLQKLYVIIPHFSVYFLHVLGSDERDIADGGEHVLTPSDFNYCLKAAISRATV
jgi:hypothetical protein